MNSSTPKFDGGLWVKDTDCALKRFQIAIFVWEDTKISSVYSNAHSRMNVLKPVSS